MNQTVEMISVPAAAILREVSAQTLAEALLERVRNGHATPGTVQRALPPIGADFEGGTYAGLTLVDNVPFALVLLPGDEQKNWQDAIAWAKDQGGMLPSRIDALVLFTNLKDRFKPEWYWTGEQYAGDEAFAWIQSFGYGNQSYDPKSDLNRARAVRRVVI